MKRIPDRCEAFARLGQVLGIHIKADEQAVGAYARQEFGTVSRPADGAIDDDHARLRIENVQDFLKQHGAVFALRGAAWLVPSLHGEDTDEGKGKRLRCRMLYVIRRSV